MPFRCARGAWAKNEEPSIDEILAEPVVQAMMARDCVDEGEVRRLLKNFIERGSTVPETTPSDGDPPTSTTLASKPFAHAAENAAGACSPYRAPDKRIAWGASDP